MGRLRNWIVGLFAIAALAVTAGVASAFSVQPLLVEMAPGGYGTIRVENNRTHPLTVEVTMWRRTVDENGVQTRTAAEDDFVVLPPQLLIQPGRVQVIRLQWVGDAPPTTSASYYANLREVPIELPRTEGSAQVQVAFAFDVAVQVSPRNSTANLNLTRAEIARNSSGAVVARLLIENSGNRYAYLHQASYELEVLNAQGAVTARPSFDEDALAEALSVTLLEPGKRRVVDLPLTGVSDAASVRGRIRARAS